MNKLGVTGIRIYRWACGHTLRDQVRYDQGETESRESHREVQESEAGWFGHVKRRYQEYVEKQTLEMVSYGKRRRGMPKQ